MVRRLSRFHGFLIVSAALVAVVVVAAGLLVGAFFERYVLAREEAQTAAIVKNQAQQHLTARHFEAASDPAAQQDFRAFLEGLPGVFRIKAYNRTRRIVWSNEPRLIGQTFPDNPHLLAALRGRVTTVLETPKRAEHIFERDRGYIAEAYVPVVFPGTSEAAGVIETYKDMTAVLQDLWWTRRLVWSVAGGMGLFLYAALAFVVWRASASEEQAIRRLERHNEDLEAQVAERTRQLVQTEKLAAMGTLLAGVAHELNNPLSVVMGQAAILKDTAADDRVRERAGKIAEGADRCARILKNFLALARQRDPERQKTALNRVVEEALELIAYPLRVDSVEVTKRLEGALPEIWADRHELGQVIVNLLSNAHHAMRSSSPPRRLSVTTGWDGEKSRAFVEVADSGPGIPAGLRSRIFEPFYTTKPPGEGTGLGLYLCHRIVAGHGGSVAVVDGQGPGATFRIELPLGAPPEVVTTGPSERTAERERAGAILVVDDEPGIVEMLREVFSSDGHAVETAKDGLEALDRLAGRSFDAILVDLKMPGLDGPGLYREALRRDPAAARRMVFMTGDDMGEQSRNFLEELGARALSKPFDLAAVRRAVAGVMATREATR